MMQTEMIDQDFGAQEMPPILAAKNVTEVLHYVEKSGSSFLAGMMALPANRKKGMFALYAFCRVVDDIADSNWPAPMRLQQLGLWREYVSDLFKGTLRHPVIELLQEPVMEFDLREQDFHDIIEGMEMDGRADIILPDWNTLDRYCDHVASAVGRISVRIFGEGSDASRLVAYHLGRALQLTNILRDIDEDAQRGRFYLPREAVEEAGIATKDIGIILVHPALDQACRAVARRATQHFDAARSAMQNCNKKAMKPAQLMCDYYAKIFAVMLMKGWDAPRARASLGFFDKLGLFAKVYF
jgi:phytoene synthase